MVNNNENAYNKIYAWFCIDKLMIIVSLLNIIYIIVIKIL